MRLAGGGGGGEGGTRPPLLVLQDDLVHQRRVGEAAALRLPDHIRLAALVCG